MRTMGSEELRLTLAQVIDRAAAGEEIVITRRGRPRVRLSPAVEPLDAIPGLTLAGCGNISPMSDELITDRIEALVAEEKRLEAQEGRDAGDEAALAADRERLEQVRIELDRVYDLLRQRRALREAGEDPADAEPRHAGTVENYLQ